MKKFFVSLACIMLPHVLYASDTPAFTIQQNPPQDATRIPFGDRRMWIPYGGVGASMRDPYVDWSDRVQVDSK